MFTLGDGSIVKKGMTIILGRGLPKEYGRPGKEFKVVVIGGDHDAVGIKSETEMPSWHDLDGYLNHYGYGFWLSNSDLEHYTAKDYHRKFTVCKEVTHKGVSLKGKDCKYLFRTITGEYMVEFKDNVGGLSGDGRGKAGHCLAIKRECLAETKSKTVKAKKAENDNF